MKYSNIKEGIFLDRPNRFIAHVLIEGKEAVCHVKNTGRCKELLIPGASKVFIQDHGDISGRKTRYSLIGVDKNGLLINMDSQAPNAVVKEWICSGGFLPNLDLVKPEKKYGDSRFDFYMEKDDRKLFLEVKGVTLEKNRVAMFPDAPTERGVKHVKELMSCLEQGYEAYLLFLVQMEGMKKMIPNEKEQPAFGEALRKAEEKGVHIFAMDCLVKPDELTIGKPVKIDLGR